MQKQILLLLVIASFTFVLLLGGAFAVYTTKPELLGLPPKPVDSTKVAALKPPKPVIKVDSVAIKKEKERLRLIVEKDSLQKIIRRFNDSLNQAKSSSDYNAAKVSELNLELSKRQQLSLKRQDSVRQANLTAFAQMYNTASPKEVAQILQQLKDPADAAQILKMMKKKNAARVIGFMSPEIAAKMLLLKSRIPDDSSETGLKAEN